MAHNIVNVEQGSKEWHDLRKTKITATDACVIMQASPWKTKQQLYYEKTAVDYEVVTNERMQRGLELEPIAREAFIFETGTFVTPAVVVKDWAMASLDGITKDGSYIIEIKCPSPKYHEIALQGRVPDHYYPQLQHQMYVTDLQEAGYVSFDGEDFVCIKVKRDDAYIEKMVEEEKKFYECLVNRTPPQEFL
jgi:putative phage-type endonuclease